MKPATDFFQGSEAHRRLYASLRSKDSRFDGRFFVGVTSTGIYCRPICRARLPKEEHCVFFASAAEAEKAGFRPCLLCRPELAPGFSPADAGAALASRAARFLEENCSEELSLPALAARLGYSDRHLRRVFAQAYHVSPLEYRQTCRLLLAKSLLTDTTLPVTQVALTAGFGSVRRFNDLFRRQYRLTPSEFRGGAGGGASSGDITVALGYRPPYRWESLLTFLAARAIPGVEDVSQGEYRRTVRLWDRHGKPAAGCVRVGCHPEKSLLSVTLSESLLPVLPQLLGRLRSLFDLSCEPQEVARALVSLNGLVPGAFSCGLRVPGCLDPFELCVRAVLGQQISVRAASRLAGRLTAAFGPALDGGLPGLNRLFPSPEELLCRESTPGELLGSLGIIGARAGAVAALARVFKEHPPDFRLCADPEEELKKLTALRGIGPWTASYIGMRALGWTDALPESDLVLRRALGGRTSREVQALLLPFRPWRSYAVMALWESQRKKDASGAPR